MRICVIHPNACSKSAKELAEALGGDAINPSERYFYPFRYDFVFNYGLSGFNSQVNKSRAIENCVNKLTTFKVLEKAGVPIPEYETSPIKAARWDIVVCRESQNGRGNDGMSYWIKPELNLPKGLLFTKYFEHEWEYRIVVFKGKVVGRYRKDELEPGKWQFTKMLKQGFENVDRSCLQAAEALQIDYVGFDVLENKEGVYVVLEANSGPILTEEAKKAIVKYVRGLK